MTDLLQILSMAARVENRRYPGIEGGEEDTAVYVSDFDGSYLTHVGMEEKLSFLSKFEITKELRSASGDPDTTAAMGFSPKNQRWFGWSHRGIASFGIGSEVNPGDCAYRASDREAFLKEVVAFWDVEGHEATTGEFVVPDEGDFEGTEGVEASWVYGDQVKNEKLRGSVSSIFTPFPDTWGRGSWTAATLEDAKEMARDYARGVS